ncbi:uncharacterized protein VTP21DRAFT_250 [Calcarisporiella thermophila]|uniref:uncharacterized protein n=1 Tax=Calcarisporiella thermophila TaxID=911321 RepID=UPI0037449984
MHLSDYSYLERAVSFSFLFVYIIIHIYRTDKFACFRWSKIRHFQIKTIMTLFIFIALPLQLYYDVRTSIFKYQEGFLHDPRTDIIVSKPDNLWSPGNRDAILSTEFALMVGFSMQMGMLSLLQIFWNFLASTFTKTTFVGSFEFRAYLVWCAGSIITFPLLEYFYKNDHVKAEAVPQLFYAFELLLVSLLGIVSEIRFRHLLGITHTQSNSKEIATKLAYFCSMNRLLSAVTMIGSITMFILSVDGLTSEQVIAHNKFASDILIATFNFMAMFVWILLLFIFYPNAAFMHGSNSTRVTTSQSLPTTRPDLSSLRDSARIQPQDPLPMNSFTEDPLEHEHELYRQHNLPRPPPRNGHRDKPRMISNFVSQQLVMEEPENELDEATWGYYEMEEKGRPLEIRNKSSFEYGGDGISRASSRAGLIRPMRSRDIEAGGIHP